MVTQILMKALAAVSALFSSIFVGVGLQAYLDGVLPFHTFWVGSLFGICTLAVCFYVILQPYRGKP